MKTVKVTTFVHQMIGAIEPDIYSTFCCDMSKHGYILIGKHTFDFPIPENYNPVAAEIATIEEKLTEMSDEYMQKSHALKTRIQELLALENKPTNTD